MHISQHTIRKQDFIRKLLLLLMLLLSFGASYAQNDSIASNDSTLSAARSTRASEVNTTQKFYSTDLYAAQYAGGTGTKEDPFLIANDLQLAKLAHDVTNGTATSGKYYKLIDDIHLTQGLWMPIGTTSAKVDRYFAGKFNGNGHTIKDMHISWTNESGSQSRWGLFAKIKGSGTSESQFAAVSNLVIDGALVEMKEGYTPQGTDLIKLGILAGEACDNTEISNIIIRNSKLTDNEKKYTSNCQYRIGGVAGYLENAPYRIFNIVSGAEVNMLKAATCTKVIRMGGIFGNASGFKKDQKYYIPPTNIFAHGKVITNFSNKSISVGEIMAFYSGDFFKQFPAANKKTLYYTQDKITTSGSTSYSLGEKKTEDFITDFVKQVNQFIEDNNLEAERWSYSTSTGTASFINNSIKVERGTEDQLSVEKNDKPSEDTYNWYVSEDNQDFEQRNTDASSTFTLPRQSYAQYVYAVKLDGSERTPTILVKPIHVSAELSTDKSNGTTKYIVTVTNDVKNADGTDVSTDALGLDIKYQWYKGETPIDNATSREFTPTNATLGDKFYCRVNVKSGELQLLEDKDLYITTFIYLCPQSCTAKGTTYRAGDDTHDGYTPETAVKTWQGAYSKLNDKGSWDENVIVLMGTSKESDTNGTGIGFVNNNTNSVNWDDLKNTLSLFRNVTITGKMDDIDYQGVIETTASTGIFLYGDTRFQHITFHSTNNALYNNIYCQYNNLEMGEGVKMTDFTIAQKYAKIEGSNTASFQVFGGFYNDYRFIPLSTENKIKAMEAAMPHGKEGFSITLKSGYFTSVCVGGRQDNNGNQLNGIAGTPNMPIKCTITVDINKKWNDYAPILNNQEADYDVGMILAGNHEGAMYADVDIIVKSGRVGRIINGTLGGQTDVPFSYAGTNYKMPCNSFMGRANITLDPESSEFAKTDEQTANERVIVTELYGGSTGRGFKDKGQVNNPFYGYSTITIKGGTFKILPEGNKQTASIFCGIYGAGAGGTNGIGYGKDENDQTADTHTSDERIPYWNTDKTVMLYGGYATATANNSANLITYRCYNAEDGSFTEVDPLKTNTKIVITSGVFGSEDSPIDGIYAAGSGYMSTGLWVSNSIPNANGGNVYGQEGETVASLTINGGEFHCKNGIFGAGRGTNYYYSTNYYGGSATNYKALGRTFGNVELDINGGTFYCPIFGGGYGVADAQLKNSNTIETLTDMASLVGKSTVNIMGGTFFENIYGGGDMANVRYSKAEKYATNVTIGEEADIRGSVFAGGNGRALRPSTQGFKEGDDLTQSPEKVGLVDGSTSLTFTGNTQLSPYIYGDIYGGGNLAQVSGDTHINIYAAHFAGQIFGGGNGKIDTNTTTNTTTTTSADILGNTHVTLSRDYGGQEDGEDSKKKDNFSINVIWNKIWDSTNKKFIEWTDADTKEENDNFFKDGKFINPHNIYGGGNLACKVTGVATVEVLKGMTPFELLETQQWKSSYTDNKNPHFSVFGGGYGANTQVGSTDVTVNVEGDYGVYDAEVDDNTDQLARPHTKNNKNKARKAARSGTSEQKDNNTLPVFDNSKGIPNFTVLGVLGGGYAGTVIDSTLVTVDGQTFLHRVYGGGFGDPDATSENDATGLVGGDAKVYIKGAKIYGDVFGGGAGVAPKSTSDTSNPYTYFTKVARVNGTAMVKISDDAKVYGNVYGGGDMANVGEAITDRPANYYASLPTSESEIDQSTAAFKSYTATNYKTFVNIIGGDIYGEVFGGGKGLKKEKAPEYQKVGRINGNTLVHVANTNNAEFSTEVIDPEGNAIPYVWSRIYGGCAYGVVDGNTLVHIEGGMLGLNIFGGGYGDVPITDDQTTETIGESTNMKTLQQVLGKKCDSQDVTYANILGNTKVQIDGGSWIWNRKADINGNITTWTGAEAQNNKICINLDEFKQIAAAIKNAKTLDDITDAKAKAAIDKIKNDKDTQAFFDIKTYTFKKNHNIFGGGNRACLVGYAVDGTKLKDANTGKSVVEINHSPITDITDTKDNLISLLDCTTLQGLCWYLCSRSIHHPQFSVFGAGYGVNTKVGSTEVYARPGAYANDEGTAAIEIAGKKLRYLNQRADMLTYNTFEEGIHDDFLKVTKEDKKKYYGSIDGGNADGSDNDPKTFRRYRSSRLAWTLGIPNFTFMDIHGGGFSGYVEGNTYVESDCQLSCLNIFGAGLGAEPYGKLNITENKSKGNTANYDFGEVGGNSMVFIKAGNVSSNVYGGGAGIESAHYNSNQEIVDTQDATDYPLVDFPEMARVKGKTEVHIYGETITNKRDNIQNEVERTTIFGNVYGGGDVANVGKTKADAQTFDHTVYEGDGITRTSLVNIRGGVIFSEIFAGGKGRSASACSNYKNLGGIYGNTCLILDRPSEKMVYPYRDTKTGESFNPASIGSNRETAYDPFKKENMQHPADGVNSDKIAYLWNRVYGGCQSGTVYGNTIVAVNDGYIAHNIFGGGLGSIETIQNGNTEEESITSADITGNTNLVITGGEAKLTSYWHADTRSWEPAATNNGNSNTYSPQYDHESRKFKINHNIYAGGNAACVVGEKDASGNTIANSGNTSLIMVKGILKTTTAVKPGVESENTDYNFFETDEWKEVYNKIGSPHFCIFGGGFGEHTDVLGNTQVNIQMAARSELGKIEDINPDEAYKHFYSGYSMMDIVGGGYSGKVEGSTHILGTGGIFCRRVFGGGFFNSVNSTKVDIKAIDCQDIFGGGLMGDVIKTTSITIGELKNSTGDTSSTSAASSSNYNNEDIYIHGNVYGGNDVSGYVNINDDNGFFAANGGDGTNIHIYGGHIYGDVYGAGNGDYLYALDRKGNTKVTVNEDYPLNPNDPNSETVDLVYTVPMRESMPSYKAASDAAKIVNINSWRPLTNKTEIHIEGVSTSDKVQIDGAVYGGGNSATVMKVQAHATEAQSVDLEGSVDINIGSHVHIGKVFMGCNGDALFTATEDNNFMSKFQRLNGSIYDATKELNFADTIDWVKDPSNVSIDELYLPTKAKDRPSVYPHLIDLYFQPVEMNFQGKLWWGNEKLLTDCTISSFFCGGNRGNMNVYPDNDGNAVNYTFPAGLTITDKIVGGCNRANYEYIGTNKKVTHEGGYLLGLVNMNGMNTVPVQTANSDGGTDNVDTSNQRPYIKLNIKNQFVPSENETKDAYQGGNVYGGCYETGTVKGNITIQMQSDMLKDKVEAKLKKSNDLLAKDPKYAALNVYGAGFGMESYVYGNTHIVMGDSVPCIKPEISESGTFNGCGVSANKDCGVSANFVYGGGQQGNVIGVTNVEIKNGHIYRSVTGGSYSGFVWGSTQVKVGYPKYYRCMQTGRYYLKRADQDQKHLALKNSDESPTIKQMIYLTEGDLVSQGVYEDAYAIDNGSEDKKIEFDKTDKKEGYLVLVSEVPLEKVGWNNVNIQIDEAVYGGGYSLAQGSSVLANNTTVLKYTDQYNLDNTSDSELNGGSNEGAITSTVGFGGNTTILVGDNTESEHITISHQEMNPIDLPNGTDLFGYYYKHYDDQQSDKYTYRYISIQDKYFKGSSIPTGLKDNMKENQFYEYDSDGGIFGDGHLSYAEGFRCADVTGYGFAAHTIDDPKIINTFQRMDILRLEDNCFTLLGARDYTINEINKTPYSISRVGEIKMVASDDKIALTENKNLLTKDSSTHKYNVRARNYMGLANNIHYVGAMYSNVAFSDLWHSGKGALASNATSEEEEEDKAFAGKSYKEVKQQYIDNYNKADNTDTDKYGTFQKRNDGTAKNMIGIASGYALKIQLCQESYDEASNKMTEKIHYGPVYGVIEMNLIEVREDEGGGYVYADNYHKRAEGDSHEEDFLETTGNFVFPYAGGRYIVDDCFPTGYKTLTENEQTPDDVEVHYWYVTGFHYYYNAHITGYTFNSSAENPIKFDSDNNDGLTTLAGLKGGQKVRVHSWKMRSGHPAEFNSDLEKRNYLKEGDKSYNAKVAGGYKLYVGGSTSNKYEDPTNLADTKKGFAAILPMNATGTYNENLINSTLPTLLDEDAKISFQLVDQVDNTNHAEENYYEDHLSKKSMATLILKAPAYESYTSETVNKPLYGEVKDFYTYNSNTKDYEHATSGTLSAGTVYYVKDQAEEFTRIDKLYQKEGENYSEIALSAVNTSSGNTYYIPREYTYTIYLTIDYVQGPTISGGITIENCALPGEMIRLKKNNVKIDADQSFSANGYYWHIGKLKADGTFDEESSWNTKSSNTYKSGDPTENRNDYFTGAKYDKTNDYLDIPAYYYMNGYGVQLAITMNGFQDQLFPVTMSADDRLVIHNYHEMDPHKEGVDLHIPNAIKCAQTEKDFAEPRIYISDQQDLTAFGKFITTVSNEGGKNAQFILQNDLTLPSDYTGGNATFQGTFHGNGHVIQGLKANQTLFAETDGEIYNLGLALGKISNTTASNGKKEHYHCCFEYDKDSPVVYGLDGKVNTSYTADDFKYGKVAYDLNGYYLHALEISKKSTDKTALKEALQKEAALKYIYDYFANGDYQYAHRSDAITGRVTGLTYLRTGKESDQPNYGQAETRHDKTHTIDKARAQNYVEASTSEDGVTTPASRTGNYLPLFNDAGNGTEVKNDFLFWGQSLQSTPADYPSTIGYNQNNDKVFCHQNNYMANRVYRTDGYYGTTTASKFYYNAYYQGNSSMSTYVHIPTTTAIDFTATDDNATIFHDFIIKEGVSKNLLVYTAANDAAGEDSNEAYDIVNKTLSYNESTQESLIEGHHIVKSANGESFATPYLHLVERTPEDENSEGALCKNNDFCAPKAFTVTNRAWYVRKPMYYAEDATGAWEGICLPFTAKKVEASLNGEITHFYGAETSEASDANGINTTTQHHEYWLRGLTTIGTETDGKTAATFMRPGDSSSSSTGTALFTQGYSEKMSNYTFNNSFFVDTYGDRLYNKVDNPYYTQTQEYKDYLPLAANVPYVVRFPGYRYYEFDLSSQFYNNLTGKNAEAQTITFNAYGEKSSESQKSAIGIPITGTMSTAANGYAHQGTFAAKLVASGELYGMNAEGTAFNDASTLQTVMPFRTYISKATQAASSARATSESRTATTPSVIYISEGRSIENINPEVKGDENETGDYLTVRPLGQRRVRIESTYATQLNVYTLSGQLFRVLDVQPGTATYSGFYPAVYIFGRTKVIVK